jgi:antitoxin (DNA-binding transcriptional repressor) of toxin-antitoxin stability system
MVAISLSEIQRDFPTYLRRVEAGEVFVITDQDRPVAEITPTFVGLSGQHRIDLIDYLRGRIDDAHIPQRWRDEGVAEPTDECRRVCLELAERLFHKYGLLPAKVVASRQEGIYLDYKLPFKDRTLGIEVDNELDAVAVVADANGTLASAAFQGDGSDAILRVFFEGLATSSDDSRSANT